MRDERGLLKGLKDIVSCIVGLGVLLQKFFGFMGRKWCIQMFFFFFGGGSFYPNTHTPDSLKKFPSDLH